jgi:hypothetical protein
VKAERTKAVKPQVAKPQTTKTQAAKPQAATPQSVMMQKSPQMTQIARPQMMNRTTSVQPIRKTAQALQPLTPTQQIAQENQKNPHNEKIKR